MTIFGFALPVLSLIAFAAISALLVRVARGTPK
jgi:hypothetical protein